MLKDIFIDRYNATYYIAWIYVLVNGMLKDVFIDRFMMQHIGCI